MKRRVLFLAPFLLLVFLGCAVLRSTRLGGTTGYVGANDGDHELRAVTLSVEPFAAMRPEGEVSPSSSQFELMVIQRDQYAAMVADMEHHVCTVVAAPVEHVEPEHDHAWWQEPETFLYVVGAVLALLGGGAGVRRWRRKEDQPEA